MCLGIGIREREMSCRDSIPINVDPVVAAAMQEATQLTDAEREIILGVLGRDELLRREQQLRVLHLKAELQTLRRRGALKPSDAQPASDPDPDRYCRRCRVELGRVINRGALCRACRLRVCKNCREYSLKTSDWVCLVCRKQMEIQAASGEWMNEFVRRPNKKKVLVPTADIIKRTIRRSWTISNPTPRWNLTRGSPERRPYNSLPRNQDINNYPSLILYQQKLSPHFKRRERPRRTQSEDIYEENEKDNIKSVIVKDKIIEQSRKNDRNAVEKRVSFEKSEPSPGRRNLVQYQMEEEVVVTKNPNKPQIYHEYSSENESVNYQDGQVDVADGSVLVETCDIEPFSGTVFRKMMVRRQKRQNERKMVATSTENGWRTTSTRDSDLWDILMPESDDYKLVFINSNSNSNSDGSSKEESSSKEEDDNDSTSTSSFPIDECDWDYFEPGAATKTVPGLNNWSPPFGSPGVCRRDVAVVGSPVGSPSVYRRLKRDSETFTDEETTPQHHHHHQQESSLQLLHIQQHAEKTKPCHACGAPTSTTTLTKYIPIPVAVPVPIPFPVPYPPQQQHQHRNLWYSTYFNSVIWPGAIMSSTGHEEEHQQQQYNTNNNSKSGDVDADIELSGYLECDKLSSDDDGDDDDDEESGKKYSRVYKVNSDSSDDDDAFDENSSDCEDESGRDDESYNTDDSDSDTGVDDGEKKKFSRVFVVNKEGSDNESSCMSESNSSDNDTDTEMDCTVILTNMKQLDELICDKTSDNIKSDVKLVNDSLIETPVYEELGERSVINEEGIGIGDVPPGAEPDSDSVEVEVCSGNGRNAVNNCGGGGAKYTSLVMITAPDYDRQQVNVVTSDTTKVVKENDDEDGVVVRHTNRQVLEDDKRGNNTDSQMEEKETVTVITGADTLSAFEEGLADDDSWVENLSHDEDEFATEDSSSSGEEVTLTCSAAVDYEEDLRGYHRAAIDFTLHTIVEESCEESEIEQAPKKKKDRPASATDLEKYFFFGLADNNSVPSSNRDECMSETSSIYSEGMESLNEEPQQQQQQQPQNESDPAELASSRLEKYFLSGFMGFTERRDSDGSVGSDSEGKPSPEQRRKRLVRARGTGRSHSSSLDNLDNVIEQEPANSEDSSSSGTEIEDNNSFDGQFDTVKRKKNKKSNKNDETTKTETEDTLVEEDGNKTPQPEPSSSTTISLSNLTMVTNANKQSRDSGFVGSCDDLLKEQNDTATISTPVAIEANKIDDKIVQQTLIRKDSFNNWSSDEETNLMMCKMRQFFKTMVANSQLNKQSSPRCAPSPLTKRCKPPQLVYFENELTRLMKTVPGIREDQVREIVEYLSSEDTWSDSYDSSDYTSSDLEISTTKSALQQQISDSCKEIINKFDGTIDDEGDEGDGGLNGLNKETAFVYQKLVASFEKIASGDDTKITPHNSPSLIAKVMHHIGSRLVALMHEVSSGESHSSNSPKTKHYHRKLVHKISSASSTTTEDDYQEYHREDAYVVLPRSKSHDLLLSGGGETKTPQNASDTTEEKEASDCERFSWRGSFESALLASDSRNKLSVLGETSVAAKRRSAGDLLFNHRSREQLDRVRSCGSIGGASSEDKLWVSSAIRPNRRRSSVPDASCGSGGSADGEDEDDDLPRGCLQGGGAPTTNSLPRLPTSVASSVIQKSQSHHFLSQNVKSARYRPPGFSSRLTAVPKRAVSAPGLQPTHQRRGRRSQHNNNVPSNDDSGVSEAHSSPMLTSTPKSNPKLGANHAAVPTAASGLKRNGSRVGQDWQSDEDFERLGHGRASLSTLGARSDSMASVYSGAGEGRYGTVAVRGQVEFGLQYNYKASALEIHIKQCKDLAPVDTKRNRSDPYVKVYLLPDKSKSGKRKTKVKKHTLNPVFDESLKFQTTLNDLESRTLWLTVWHSDMFGRNDFLGEVMMALENKVFDDPTPKWYNLQERTEPFEEVPSYRGDVIVGLKFIPPDMTVQKKGKRSRGALHVLVKEAKSLTAVKANGTSDPFCKSYLLPDKGRSSKQKTPVAKRTTNPVWNYTFVYDDVTLQELSERCLELTVWDHDRLASNEFLGGVRFSLGTGKYHGKAVDWMDATGRELSLWKDMLEKPNFWVEGSLSLRSTLEARGS